MNTTNAYTDAERQAAKVIAANASGLSIRMSDYAEPADREAAAEALRARVAEMLLGDAFVIVPRYVLADIRKQLEDVQ